MDISPYGTFLSLVVGEFYRNTLILRKFALLENLP